MDFSLESFLPSKLVQKQEDIFRIYASVYTQPPYNENAEQLKKFRDTWPQKIDKNGFKFWGLSEERLGVVGFAYGWKSSMTDAFTRKIFDALGEKAEYWLEDCFEFVDLALLPRFQGRGLGRDLVSSLFSNLESKTALLLTHQQRTKALSLYEAEGWITLKENFLTDFGKAFRIMGKNLNSRG